MTKKRTPGELYKKSKELYDNILEKGKNGQTSKWAYYYCKCILNKKKDVPIKFIQSDAKNVTGQDINVTLTKKEYLAKMKKYCEWVEKHKSLPNNVTIKGKKVKPKIWNAYVGYLFKVYYETNKLPESYPIKTNIYKTNKKTESSKNSVSKPLGKDKLVLKDYLTGQGCSGIGQCTSYYCACNSLQQSFYRLTGIKVEEKTIAGWAGTTSSGTSHQGIETAVAQFNKTYKKNIKITWKNFSELGSNESERWKNLQKHIDNGAVFCHIAYRRTNSFKGYGHYEVIKSVNEANLSILNSLGKSCGNGTYCGYIETRTKATQLFYMNGISQKSIAILTN